MYIVLIYPVISKAPKHLTNCLKIVETSVILSVFKSAMCDVSAYMVTFSIVQQESGTRKAIFWSVTINNKIIIQSMQFDCSN